jgi:hypothetical protein
MQKPNRLLSSLLFNKVLSLRSLFEQCKFFLSRSRLLYNTDTMSVNTLKKYVSEDGIDMEIIGWHQPRYAKQFLVRYTHHAVQGRSTHELIDWVFMPPDIRETLICDDNSNISQLANENVGRIRLEGVRQVLDMAWCSGAAPPCTPYCLTADFPFDSSSRRKPFQHVFVLLEWKDDQEKLHVTWEFAETLLSLMEERHCIRLMRR